MAIGTEALSAQVVRQRKTRRFGLVMLGLILTAVSFGRAKIHGDGMEYVMMAHGFYRHATPELRPADIADMAAVPDEAARKSGLLKDQLAAVPEHIARDGTMPMGFTQSKSSGIQAIHFWMYSLLATPFYALTALLGLNPALAFTALNLLAVGLAAGCILRWYPRAGLTEALLIILLGPLLYAHWTGPEVVSACCALVATLAMLRRDTALAVALAGLGATQNPSIAGLIVAAGAFHALLALRPAWAPGPRIDRPLPRNATLLALGILLAVLPYAYNELVFGIPSIIAVNFTNPSLVSLNRLTSVFLDLNQGMAVGFPGLVIALVLLTSWLGKPLRRRWLAYVAGAMALTAGLIAPPLATVNWNNDCVLILRYAYWAAMPLVAVCIVGLTQLAAGRRRAVLTAVVVCQGLTLWQAGWPRGSTYLSHTHLASWVLEHAPGLYNPDPEIFYEREMRVERDIAKDAVVIHPGAHGPTKLMRYWTNTADSAGICPAGQVLLSPGSSMASGWQYFNAPFRCGAMR